MQTDQTYVISNPVVGYHIQNTWVNLPTGTKILVYPNGEPGEPVYMRTSVDEDYKRLLVQGTELPVTNDELPMFAYRLYDPLPVEKDLYVITSSYQVGYGLGISWVDLKKGDEIYVLRGGANNGIVRMTRKDDDIVLWMRKSGNQETVSMDELPTYARRMADIISEIPASIDQLIEDRTHITLNLKKMGAYTVDKHFKVYTNQKLHVITIIFCNEGGVGFLDQVERDGKTVTKRKFVSIETFYSNYAKYRLP